MKNKVLRKLNLWTCWGTFLYRWENNIEDVTYAVHVNHNVTKCTSWYEPFYVARADTPDYDERFIGYGFTRNTQVLPRRLLRCSRLTQQHNVRTKFGEIRSVGSKV
jgi:hypothetical protein